jgi:PAS domain S-box-containing protein
MLLESDAETLALRTALRELVALSTIPAAWVGREPPVIAAGLADVLVGSLHLDFGFVRLCDPKGGSTVEVTRGNAWNAFPEWLQTHADGSGKFSCKELVSNLGDGEPCRGVVIPVGVNGDAGLVAAARTGADFPSEVDLLLLSVAANHAAAAFQNARLRRELDAKVAELGQARNELETKVSERTADLQRSEAYLAEAQRLTHTGSFGWKPSTGEIIWSDETFRIFQYDRTITPTIELFLHRVHPGDLASVKETVERASSGGKDFEHEYRLVMPDGAVKHVHVVAHALSAESGGFEFIGAVMDTSESKRVEKKLRRSEESLLEAQKISHTGSWRHEVASGVVKVSPEIYRIHDINPDEDTSNTEFFFSRFHPEDRSRVVDLFERSEREKTEFEVDYRILLPDGTIRHLHTTGHPVLNESGDLLEFVGTAMDVTPAKQAEEALRRSENYLAEAQRLSHTGSWARVCPTGEMKYWSEECYHVLGFDPHGEKPRFETFLLRVHPDDRAKVREITEAANRERVKYEVDYRIVHPDGEMRDVRTVGRPVFGASGEVVEFVGTVMDVTERKRAEEERERLRQLQADLAHLSRVTTMGELTASLAHEIKQPITAAVTDARTCLRWLNRATPDLPEASEAASRTVKDVMRAADIIGKISLLFKKGAAQRELIDVNELIREMIVLLRSEATRYSISIHTELAGDLPKVTADRVQLQQVFMNLMLNGIDAMKETKGGGELIIKSEFCDGQLLISVRDTGAGLAAEQAEQIFKAFFTTKDNGTGMGLPISRSIIEAHGGRLWATGTPGTGATFHFTLPATAAAHA